jgi:hypothetical protein
LLLSFLSLLSVHFLFLIEVLLVGFKVLLLELELVNENFKKGTRLYPAIVYVRDETENALRSSRTGFVIVDTEPNIMAAINADT